MVSSIWFTLLKFSELILVRVVAVLSILEERVQVYLITSIIVKSFGASPRSESYFSEALTTSPITLEYRFVYLKSYLLYDSIDIDRFFTA
jgi:hypothetical protein